MLNEFPLQVRIENTNLCNAFCTICPRERLTRPRGTMDIPLYKRIIGEIKEGGAKELHLQGYGEPFIDQTIIEKIRLAKEAGIPYTFMVTNASFLDEVVCEGLVNSGLDKLKISFYGLDRKEYERVHRGLSFEEVKANVGRLLEVKKRLRKKTPAVSLKYIGSFTRFILFALQWGFRAQVSFSRLHNYGYGRRFNEARVERENRICPIVTRSIMQVLWDGRVVPCCYDFDGRIALGDLSKESVKDVWNGEKYRDFREIHRKREYGKLPVCLNCDKLR